jgi:O-antigen ligase
VTEFESEPWLATRLVGWKLHAEHPARLPVGGLRARHFSEAWTHYYPPGTANVWKEAHNDYLKIAAETGLPGAALLAWGSWRFLRRYLFGLPRAAPGDWAGDVHVQHGIAVGLFSILLHSFVDFSLQVAAISLLFVVLSAIMVGDRARHAEA